MNFWLTLTLRLEAYLERLDRGRGRHVVFAAVLLVGMAACGWYSVRLGGFDSWDMRNYQFYSPYALLNGRFNFDYVVAQIQTFINPLPFVPFYVAVTTLSPKVAGFALGALHGISIGLTFLVGREALTRSAASTRLFGALACAGVGAYGPTFLGMMGGSGSDNIICLFVLAGVYAILRGLRTESGRWTSAGAILIGIAGGLKLTAAVFIVGGIAASLVVARTWRARWRAGLLFGAFATLGVLLSRGYWMVHLWSRYESPLFPFYNTIFKSPYFRPYDFADIRCLPKTFGDAITLPFAFFSDPKFMKMSHQFRDARYAIVYVLVLLLVVYGIGLLIARLSGRQPPAPLDRGAVFLLVFFGVSYVLWQVKFAIMRYIVPLELLAPLLILLMVRAMVPLWPLRVAVVLVAFVTITNVMVPRIVARRPWSEHYIEVARPQLEDPSNTLVVIANDRPWSYVVPFFSPEVRFVGMGNLFARAANGSKHRLRTDMEAIVAAHQGDLLLLSQPDRIVAALEEIPEYTVFRRHKSNRPFRSKHEPVAFFLYRLRAR